MNKLAFLLLAVALAAPQGGARADTMPKECEHAWREFEEAQSPAGIEWQLLQGCLERAAARK